MREGTPGKLECLTRRGRREAPFVRFGFLLKGSEEAVRYVGFSFGLAAVSEAGLEWRVY